MPYKNKEDRATRDKERYVKNRGYKKANHKGFFDGGGIFFLNKNKVATKLYP